MRQSLLKPLTRSYICSSCPRAISKRRRTFATASSSNPELYDVVCVGGGPAGLSLLTALRASPLTSSLTLALVESQDLSRASAWDPPPSEYSNRASSLTPSSKEFLELIGAWQHVDTSRVQPYQSMQVWDGISNSKISFDWSNEPDHPDSTIAYMTENNNLIRSLLTRLSSLSGVSILDKTSVSSISLGPTAPSPSPDLSLWPHITLSNSRTIAARLLIGADGPNSPVRTFADIPSRGWDYNAHGVVATLSCASAPEYPTTAYQRFLPTGPIALLPLPNNHASLVWSTTPERASFLKTLPPKDFIAIVNAGLRLMPVDLTYMHTQPCDISDELSWRLDRTPAPPSIPPLVTSLQENTVASFPLRMRHTDTYATHRIALIGDAAHTIHPLAGQGLNMGLADVSSLVKTLAFASEHGMDIGDQLSLERYNNERYATNNRLLGVVDKLQKLYSFEFSPMVGLRSWGLKAFDGWEGMKGWVMRSASG